MIKFLGTAARLGPVLVLVAIITLVMLPAQALAVAFKSPLQRQLPLIWHRIMCWIMRIRVIVHGEAETGRPLLIVANHVSWSDISVLGTVMPLSFVAKSEMKDWPVFGYLAKMQRTVFVNRNVKRETSLQAREIAQRLSKDADVIVLFAEGTTSDGTRLLPFKSALTGAAEMAMGDGGMAIIQPVAIAYTRYGGLPMGFNRRLINAWIGDLDCIALCAPGTDPRNRPARHLSLDAANPHAVSCRIVSAENRKSTFPHDAPCLVASFQRKAGNPPFRTMLEKMPGITPGLRISGEVWRFI